MVDTFMESKKFLIQTSIMSATTMELELVWLPRIMENQTKDEIDERRTHHENNIGNRYRAGDGGRSQRLQSYLDHAQNC